jgi:hypothetical protein
MKTLAKSKLATLVLVALAMSDASAFCMPPIGGPNAAYYQCKQAEAMEDQANSMRLMQQQQQMQLMQQQQQFNTIPPANPFLQQQRQCFRDVWGNVQCN